MFEMGEQKKKRKIRLTREEGLVFRPKLLRCHRIGCFGGWLVSGLGYIELKVKRMQIEREKREEEIGLEAGPVN